MIDLMDLMHGIVRFGLGGIFIFAGGVKLLSPAGFAALIGAYGILPEFLLGPAALFLPALEVLAGLGLLFRIRGSLPVVVGLLGLFIAVLSYGLVLGLDVDCGCFGPHDPEAKAFHGLKASLYRDLVLLAGVGCLAVWPRYRSARTLGTKPGRDG